ncbi:hypothetical protein ACP275_05G113500 [Erythranthe tilingii]
MVRRRVEIKAIEEKAKRHTTFTKRRQGLFKKTRDYCTLSDSQAAVIVFSAAGNFFGLGHPSLNVLVNRYISHPKSVFGKEAGGAGGSRVHGGGGGGVEDGRAEPLPLPLTETERRIVEAIERKRWDSAVRDLVPEELNELAAEVEKIKLMVVARRKEIKGKSKVDG